MTAPHGEPTNVRIELDNGECFPLFPVYIGQRPRENVEGAEQADTWVLWAHPDLDKDIEFTQGAAGTIKMDHFPAGSQLIVHQDFVVRIPRHAG